jgi:hypothetical protein
MPASVLYRQQLVPAVVQEPGQLPGMGTVLLPLSPPPLLELLLPLPLELPLLLESSPASAVFDGFDELLHAAAMATAIPPTATRTTSLTDLMDILQANESGRAHYRRLPTWWRLTFVAMSDLG